MAVPKKKKSSSKSKMHRSHNALKPPALVSCPNCAELILAHRICSFCGYYRGEKLLKVKE